MVKLNLLAFIKEWQGSYYQEAVRAVPCPKITLQRGVEQTLKHYVPEVKSIVGEDDEQAAEQGYDPYFPKDKEPDWERLVRKK